jgi:hypothetical protein
MDFLDISSLGVAYRYVVKIEQKFKHQNKQEFGSANPQQPKYEKDDPNKQPPENQSKPQEKKGHGKTKKDTGKWCDFHKIPWHNTDECRSKQSLVAEIKDKEPNPDSESDSKILIEDRSSTQTPLLLSRPQQFNQKNQQILKRGSTFFIHRCG